jgi:hypothetical protein
VVEQLPKKRKTLSSTPVLPKTKAKQNFHVLISFLTKLLRKEKFVSLTVMGV